MSDIEKLKQGYQAFFDKDFDKKEHYAELSKGQSPKTMIIACSDSRVDPIRIMGAELGDIFVVRNVANIVPPYQPNAEGLHGTSAALDFAVNGLGIQDIIILGHSGCGGIKALYSQNSDSYFINSWVNVVDSARDISSNLHECEKNAISISAENLMSFPWIADKVNAGKLNIHKWYFSLEDGKLNYL